MDYLTASDFYYFIQCPHWPYYNRFATPEEQTLRREMGEGEKRRLEHGVAHEAEIARRLLDTHKLYEVAVTFDPVKDGAATLELMRQGVPLIYQGTLTVGDWTGRPDLLERQTGESHLGAWFYVPVDIKSTHALEKYQKLQLIFYATLLEKLQGWFPAEPAIINRDGECLVFSSDQSLTEFDQFVDELERIRAGEKPDPVLRKSCFDAGPWGQVCQRSAQATNDIALLYNVDTQKLRALRLLGVRTVDDAAELDPQALDGVAKGLRLHGLEVMKRQAQSLKTGQVMVREPVVLPSTQLEIHFDIESDPPSDTDYLFGCLLRQPSGDTYRSFVAERLADEGQMWQDFLAWLETLPEDFIVYHFSPYEPARLTVLEKRYGGSPGLERFRSRLLDLKEITTRAVTMPLYFYGLKYIAPFLGFSWRGEVKNGNHSIDVFEKFLDTQERALLESILVYNEDDVRATAHLKDWLVAYAQVVNVYATPYPWKQFSISMPPRPPRAP